VLTGLRPYDLRHSFGSAVYAATGDLRAAQQLLGHASQRMTDRYTLSAVPERLQFAVGQVNELQQAGAERWQYRVAVLGPFS
jgi:integrase